VSKFTRFPWEYFSRLRRAEIGIHHHTPDDFEHADGFVS